MQEELIKEGEGFRQYVYKCTEGHLTIGYGHKLLQFQKEYLKKVTKAQAEYMLKIDILNAKKQVELWFGRETRYRIGPQRHAVLVDMVFNLGSVRWPKLTKAIKQGDYEQAAKEIQDSKYYGQVKNRAIRNAQIMKSGKIMTKQEAAKKKSQEAKKKSQEAKKKKSIADNLKSDDSQGDDLDYEEVQIGREEVSRRLVGKQYLNDRIIEKWIITYKITMKRMYKKLQKMLII